MTDEAPAFAAGESSVMRVDVGDEIMRDELLEVSGGDGTGIHGTVVDCLGIGQDDDHFFGALREGAFNRLRNMDFVSPLLGADGVSVQGVDDGIAARLFLRVTRREENENVAVCGVSFQIALESGTVNFDSLDYDRLGTGNRRGNFRLNLSGKARRECGEKEEKGAR